MPEEDLSKKIGATIQAVREQASDAASGAKERTREAGRRSVQAGRRGASGGRRVARAAGEQADSSKYVDGRRKDRQSKMYERAARAGMTRAPIDASLDPAGNTGRVVESLARANVEEDPSSTASPESGGGGLSGLLVSGSGSGGGLSSMLTGGRREDRGEASGGERGELEFEDSFGLSGGER